MIKNNLSEITFIKDSEWGAVDGEPCRIIDFTQLGAVVKEGKVSTVDKTTPYASVTLECKKLSKNATGYITHRIDFVHLWAAFRDRGVNQDEEVIIFWSKKYLKTYAKIFSAAMPKLLVMICLKGAFKLMTDASSRPELTGEARWKAEKPIVEWKPEIMK